MSNSECEPNKKIKLSDIENGINKAYRFGEPSYFNGELTPETIKALCKAVRAAKGVIDFVNPMFCDTDECLVKLRENLSPFDWSEDD